MRHLVFLLLILSIANSAKCQDLILTLKGDTISCKITRISDQFIHYSISEQSSRTRIQKEDVLSYFQKKVVTIQPEEQEMVKADSIPNVNKLEDTSKWRFALNSGHTYQFGGYEGLSTSYLRQVRSLLNLGVEIHYFSSGSVSSGIKFNRISTKTDQKFLGNLVGIEEKIRFNYFAFSILNRQSSIYDQNLFYYGISVGLISYKDVGIINGLPHLEDGKTFGVAMEVGYDFTINPDFGVGFNLGVNLARLNNLIINGTNVNSSFSVSRVDFTVGLRLFK